MIFDYFKVGIMFWDIMILFNDVKGFCWMVDELVLLYVGIKIDKVVGIEVCGFILGGVVVY